MENIHESSAVSSRSDGATDIETAVRSITTEIDRRADFPAHPLRRYQVVSSVGQERIWIASAVGSCMDLRYTPLEIGPEQAWTWHCEDPDDALEVGWRVSTPAEIVDLLVEVVGCE